VHGAEPSCTHGRRNSYARDARRLSLSNASQSFRYVCISLQTHGKIGTAAAA
jgi:hypothetical protein